MSDSDYEGTLSPPRINVSYGGLQRKSFVRFFDFPNFMSVVRGQSGSDSIPAKMAVRDPLRTLVLFLERSVTTHRTHWESLRLLLSLFRGH